MGVCIHLFPEYIPDSSPSQHSKGFHLSDMKPDLHLPNFLQKDQESFFSKMTQDFHRKREYDLPSFPSNHKDSYFNKMANDLHISDIASNIHLPNFKYSKSQDYLSKLTPNFLHQEGNQKYLPSPKAYYNNMASNFHQHSKSQGLLSKIKAYFQSHETAPAYQLYQPLSEDPKEGCAYGRLLLELLVILFLVLFFIYVLSLHNNSARTLNLNVGDQSCLNKNDDNEWMFIPKLLRNYQHHEESLGDHHSHYPAGRIHHIHHTHGRA